MILNRHGRIKYIFNKTGGLQDNNVKFLMEDNLGNVWLALAKGVSRLEYRSPLHHYNDRCGLDGMVITVTTHNGVLYAGTAQGLFVLNKNSETFNRIAGIGTCWDLLSSGKSLLAATRRGVFHIDGVDGKPVKVNAFPTFKMIPSSLFPGHTWCASNYGLVALVRKDNRWVVGNRYREIAKTIRDIAEDPAGFLWLVSSEGNIIKVKFKSISHPIITSYKKKKDFMKGIYG